MSQSSRGGVALDTERWAARALSRLTLAELRARDAGEYVCAAAGRAASLRLRVLPAGPPYALYLLLFYKLFIYLYCL